MFTAHFQAHQLRITGTEHLCRHILHVLFSFYELHHNVHINSLFFRNQKKSLKKISILRIICPKPESDHAVFSKLAPCKHELEYLLIPDR